MSDSIENALNSYVETLNQAEKDLSGLPSSVRGGWEGVKRDAQQRLPSLLESLSIAMENETTVIGLAGDPTSVKDFTTLAAQREDTIVVARDDIYTNVAERVWPTVGETKQFGPSQFGFMQTIFRGMMADMGLTVRIPLLFQDVSTVADPHELAGVVRQLIEQAVGDSLVVKFLRKEITAKAVAKRVKGEKIFVVVVDGDPQTMGALGARTIALKVSPPVSGDNVAEVFEELLGNSKKSETIEQQPQQTKKQKKSKKEEREE